MLRFRLFPAVATFLACAIGLHAQTATLTTLADFDGVTPGQTKGKGPRGALVFGADGQLYGTTELGGLDSGTGFGTVYKIDPVTGDFTNLVDFNGTSDAAKPTARLVLASDGNFYGTTFVGGADGKGTIFQMTPAGVLTIVYTFRTVSQKDTGANPTDGLVQGSDGFLYGAASTQGLNGFGTLFKIQPGTSSTPIRLVDFTGTGSQVRRGSTPSALMRAKDGHFYGTTEGGGTYGNGTIFRLTVTGVFTTMADFGVANGIYTGPQTPRATLVQAANGVLYGTSAGGGTGGNGTVFSFTTAGTYKTLINFTNSAGSFKGSTPEAPLTVGTDGFLYGTTRLGGASQRGTVFRVSTGGAFKTFVEFAGAPGGADPRGALVQDNEGNLFGTTSTGGVNGLGTIFKLSGLLPAKALVITNTVSFISGTRATLVGAINPQGTTANYWFEYGKTTAYGSRIPLTTTVSAGAGKTYVTVKQTITGLTPSTGYHYRLVATNGGGTTWGDDLSFTTGPNPNVLSSPSDQLVGVGLPAQFNVAAIGQSLKYAWTKTGSGTVLSTAATYSIAKAALSHGGTYSAKVSDGLDSVQTASAKLGVVGGFELNLKPVSGSRTINEGLHVELEVMTGGPPGLMTFQWKTVAGGNVVNSANIMGATDSKIIFQSFTAADPNTYFCKVSMGNLTFDSAHMELQIRLKPVMNAPNLGPWTTNGLAEGTISANNNPLSYASANLPPGLTLNTINGHISGRPTTPGTYVVPFSATNLAGESKPLPYTITILAASPNAIGNFKGITDRSVANNNNLGGWIDFTITNTGAGTGKLTHLGKSFSFKTTLSALPAATRAVTVTANAGQTGFPPVVASLNEATGDITGTINGTAFTAKHNPWNKLASPVPAAKMGRFNLAFNLPLAQAGNPADPQGSGYGSVTIAADGVATWVGVFGDGTNLTTTTTTTLLAGDGTIPLHKPLYSIGTGSAQGQFSIDGSSVLTEVSFDWLKNAQPANVVTRSYKNGFSALLALEVDGGPYVKPALNVNVLGLTGTTDNAELDFSLGGLPASFTQVFNLPATSSATTNNVPKFTQANPNKVTLVFNLTTGFFTGSFTLPDGRKVTNCKGALIPRLQQGFGQFQLPQLPNPTTSEILSGLIVIKAHP